MERRRRRSRPMVTSSDLPRRTRPMVTGVWPRRASLFSVGEASQPPIGQWLLASYFISFLREEKERSSFPPITY
uniref:Uncharacterized protein n=1 Tax=Picea glauca TaxID=3330 RepID=A0A117NHU5_PICGL|nr:hypothetical protein ABT39_MTgene1403 [Picea glauca]KUM48908.1 hypothetical protein ABT39_MTgene4244 [Picea glauca]